MSTVVLLSGLFIGVIATGLVFADTNRRNLAFRTRSLWTGSVGIVSIGGFLTAYLLDDGLYRLYLEMTGRPAIAPLPREIAFAFLFIVLTSSALGVLAYGFGSRYGPLKVA